MSQKQSNTTVLRSKNSNQIVKKKPFYAKWWFWVVTLLGVFILGALSAVVAVAMMEHALQRPYLFNDQNSSSQTQACDNINTCEMKALKPILYLYPQETTDVRVFLQKPDFIDVSYPAYGTNGWHVEAQPNGTLTDQNNNQYYALYWDELDDKPAAISSGFYVDKDHAASFLEEKLTAIGLNYKERDEFIMYWLPKLQHNGQNIVYFALTDELQQRNDLTIIPQPDSLLRVRMYIKKVSGPVTIAPQILPHFERSGFTAIEWGGAEL